MEFTKRQHLIIEIIKGEAPIAGNQIAKKLNLSRSALRTDFSILINTGVIKSKTKIGYTLNEKYNQKFNTRGKKELNYSASVLSIMSKALVLPDSITIKEAIIKLFTEDTGTIYITNDSKLVGVVSRKDLLKAAIGKEELTNLPINIIMSRMPNIFFLTSEATISQVVKLIVEKEIDSIPIVNPVSGGYEILGKVSKTNLSKFLCKLILKK